MATASGRYAVDTLLGQVFHGSTAVGGVALAAYNATAVTFALWNPVGSGKNAYLISCQVGFVSGSITTTAITYSYQTGVGAQKGTGSPITAATFGTPINGLVGSGNTSVMYFVPATCTLASAPSLIRSANMNMSTMVGMPLMQETFEGTFIVPPGTIFIVGTAVASGVTADVSLTWEEV